MHRMYMSRYRQKMLYPESWLSIEHGYFEMLSGYHINGTSRHVLQWHPIPGMQAT